MFHEEDELSEVLILQGTCKTIVTSNPIVIDSRHFVKPEEAMQENKNSGFHIERIK